MATTSWTQTDITTLERAIASGVFEVRYSSGDSVRFSTVDEMLKALEVIRSAVAATTPSTTISRSFVVSSMNKGL